MSNSKIISYDLRNSGKNYDALYDKIKSYSAWAQVLESTWFISTSDTCTAVRDNLKSVLDSDDGIFVAALTGVAAWYGLPNNVSEYLKENL